MLTRQKDWARVRTLYETALDVVVLERHQSCLRALLARAAIREGDVASAEQWLAGSNPRSDNLESDSEYRLARAMIDTARRDPNAVFTVLGRAHGEVPLHPRVALVAELVRANAHELRGDLPGATRALEEAIARSDASARVTLEAAAVDYGFLQLCPKSLPAARAARTKHRYRSPFRILMGLTLSWVVLWVPILICVADTIVELPGQALDALRTSIESGNLSIAISVLRSDPAQNLMGAIILAAILITLATLATIGHVWGTLERNRMLTRAVPTVGRVKSVGRLVDAETGRAGNSQQVRYEWTDASGTHEREEIILVREHPLAAGAPVMLLVDTNDPAKTIIDPD